MCRGGWLSTAVGRALAGIDPKRTYDADARMAGLQRLEPVAGCGSTLDALHQTVVWAWSHAKSRMLAVWGIADIGHHQPGWRGATDRFPVNWTGGFDPERNLVASPARTGADDKADLAVTVLGASFKTDQTPLSIYFSSSSRAKDGPDRTSAMLSEAPVRMPGSLST